MDIFFALLFIGAGLFSAICAIKEYEFFYSHRKARMLVRILGMTGTKFFYVTLGIVLLVMGVFILVHGLPQSPAP